MGYSNAIHLRDNRGKVTEGAEEALEAEVREIINDTALCFIAKLEAIIEVGGGQLCTDETEFVSGAYTLINLMENN